MPSGVFDRGRGTNFAAAHERRGFALRRRHQHLLLEATIADAIREKIATTRATIIAELAAERATAR
jgi:hypothetical protein